MMQEIGQGYKINTGKAKAIVFGREELEIEIDIKVGDQTFENVKGFIDLGSLLTWDNGYTTKIRKRIVKAKGVGHDR